MTNTHMSDAAAGVALTRCGVSAIAKLDLAGLGHAQRLEKIAGALGFASADALMATLKAAETTASRPTAAAAPGERVRAVAAFGEGVCDAISDRRRIDADMDSGDVVERDFASEAEADALGVEDAAGWMEGFIAERSDDDERDYLDACAAGKATGGSARLTAASVTPAPPKMSAP